MAETSVHLPVVATGEVDTTQPFESVKEAVHLFGEKADLKALKFPSAEKRTSMELQQLRENLAATRNQLNHAQTARDELLLELIETKRIVEMKTAELLKAFSSDEITTKQLQEIEASELSKTFDSTSLGANLDDLNAVELASSNDSELSKLEAVTEEGNEHIEEMKAAELEDSKPSEVDAIDNHSGFKATEIVVLKQLEEVATSKTFIEMGSQVDSRERATSELPEQELMASDAIIPAKGSVNTVSDTASVSATETQFVSSNRSASSLGQGEGASSEAAVERSPENAGKGSSGSTGHNVGTWLIGSDSEESSGLLDGNFEDLGSSLRDVEILATLEQHKVQLKEARDSQERLAREVAEAYSKLSEAKAEAEKARISELKASEREKSLRQELSLLTTKLNSLLEEKSLLAAASERLREELSMVRMEIAALEVQTSPGTDAELERVKAELAAVTAAELKAKETIAGVSHALQMVTRAADSAKLAAEIALGEAHNAKVDAEQAKAALLTAESELQAALREAQAAKASESMALAELKDLAERAARKESGEQRALQDERENLAKRLREAEELAKMKLAAALAQVDAAKASEHETLTKLEAAKLEVEANRLLAQEALHRAETAEAAKSVIENELRKRRKAVDPTTAHHHQHHHHHHHKGSPTPFHGTVQTPDRRVEPPLSQSMARRSLDYGYVSADVTTESIAELLQLKVAAPFNKGDAAAPGSAGSTGSDKLLKKKSLLPKLGSYLSRRRSSINSTR